MIRLLMHIFGKPYEECKSCETLKQQLEFERAEKHELLNTILGIVRPVAVPETAVVMPDRATAALPFSRRRAALEAEDRRIAMLQKSSANIGRPDGVKVSDLKVPTAAFVDNSIDALEQELKINEASQTGGEK